MRNYLSIGGLALLTGRLQIINYLLIDVQLLFGGGAVMHLLLATGAIEKNVYTDGGSVRLSVHLQGRRAFESGSRPKTVAGLCRAVGPSVST